MAQYWLPCNASSTGAVIVGDAFSGISDNPTATDGKVLVVSTMDSGARSLFVDAAAPDVTSQDGIEIYFSSLQGKNSTTNGFAGGVGIASADGAQGYVLGFTNEFYLKYHIAKWTGGGGSTQLCKFGQYDNPFANESTNQFKQARFQILADGTVRGRMWNRSNQTEPATWPLIATAQPHIAVGKVVVFVQTGVYWSTSIDYIGIGTHGDPAPTGPVGPSERPRSRIILTPW